MAWKVNNKEKQSEYFKKYRETHKELLNKRDRERFKEKYHNDPDFRAICLERARKYNEGSTKKLKLRFQILKRDDFTCQYCGRKAPDVILHIDHIHPKSKGGLNKEENYRTACLECNIGKSDCLL